MPNARCSRQNWCVLHLQNTFPDYCKVLSEWRSLDKHLCLSLKVHHQQKEKEKVGFERPLAIPGQRPLLASCFHPCARCFILGNQVASDMVPEAGSNTSSENN